MAKCWLTTFMIVITLTACSSASVPKYDETAGYKKSAINEDFIVPVNAKEQPLVFENPNILKGVKYNLHNIGGEQGLYPPMQYFRDLAQAGWEELKDERMGHVHFFRKTDKVISVVLKEDAFEVFEMRSTPTNGWNNAAEIIVE